ncbi:hypothetical protein CRG98_002806 [Punica granatum]|uniref:Uncharacterized protein n=1 Tax=Punica granatum TaxID=22663 RepID=A0A2I0L856_PUNGR|nr:hypothetical protein CRG98_002806 [Punica granatum]
MEKTWTEGGGGERYLEMKSEVTDSGGRGRTFRRNAAPEIRCSDSEREGGDGDREMPPTGSRGEICLYYCVTADLSVPPLILSVCDIEIEE